ncbi:MAG: class I SAM-dependent rRNA methyltransferase [Deltaproteobacteria bacterium]|nr:class I SAM-dependent rRNA methyltransferase [Deltaproteobacteria bacterium]
MEYWTAGERRLPVARITAKGMRWQRTGHPWLYRDDLAGDVKLPSGELAAVVGPQDRFLGQAFYSAHSRIALRFVTYADEAVDAAFWEQRLRCALDFRRKVVQDSDAFRLIYSESDGFPGLVADSYAGHLVLQTLHPGMERLLPEIIKLLERHLSPRSITLRHDAEVRILEGLPREVKVVSGKLPERMEVQSSGVRFWVDIRGGQKTGLFLDQRENRAVAAALVRGRVLDAFAYQGSFAMHLASRADHVTLVDTSAAALEMARANGQLNNLSNLEFVRENVFAYLKSAVAAGQRFDGIVLDPPAFAKSRGERAAAARGYREINRRAFQLLNPGGVLVTCSCSYNLSEGDFLGIVREAAADAQRQARLIERRGAAADHPALLSLPESLYLKCLILEVV